jgi:hypothetical protein
MMVLKLKLRRAHKYKVFTSPISFFLLPAFSFLPSIVITFTTPSTLHYHWLEPFTVEHQLALNGR